MDVGRLFVLVVLALVCGALLFFAAVAPLVVREQYVRSLARVAHPRLLWSLFLAGSEAVSAGGICLLVTLFLNGVGMPRLLNVASPLFNVLLLIGFGFMFTGAAVMAGAFVKLGTIVR